jgi:signal transduction histidine kinase
MTKTKHSPSLRRTIWIYFAIFTSGILILLWLTFVVSMESNYRLMKTRQFNETADFILSGLSDRTLSIERLDELAYANGMCVTILNAYGEPVYSYDMMAGKCLIHSNNMFTLYDYRRRAQETPDGVYYAEVRNSRFNVNTLLFVMIIGGNENPQGVVFLNTSLEPLESTVGIIRGQVLMISVLMLILGIGISYILSRLFEAPILRITKSAERLGGGDFGVSFDGKGYAETESLAHTLNFAAGEISKVDVLRRDLIANVSHDLRTPLTMIKAYAEMVRDLSGDNPKKRAEHVGVIIDESDRLASLVSDLLDLSKLESGVTALNLTEFDLAERIISIMERYSYLAEREGYKFFVSVPDKFIISGDLIKFEQVIYNLINNAVNYTGENKCVYVMLRVTGEHTARIEITDTGAGIAPEQIPLIFDRYYRTEKSKREVIGSGLGLAIVKQILKLHGYKYGIMSEVGVGSTFWVEVTGEKDK